MFDQKNHNDNYYRSLRGQLTHRMCAARARAKSKGLDFDLDIEFLEGLWRAQEGKCSVSGMTMIAGDVGNPKQRGPMTLSLDRKDSTKGYTKDNVQLTTSAINHFKGFGTEEMLKQLAFAYLQNNGYKLEKVGA